jgi:hypothetical protein
MGKTVPETFSTVIPPSNPNASKGDVDAPVVQEEAELEPIGEEFLEAIQGVGKQTQFTCKICDCTMGDPIAKNLHIRGRRHRLMYKVNLTRLFMK